MAEERPRSTTDFLSVLTKMVFSRIGISLIHPIILGASVAECLFPSFTEKASKQTNDKTNSAVAGLWTSCFKALCRQFQCLTETLNLLLSSHYGKKGSNQMMAESAVLSGMAQIFRSGWEVRSVHAVFNNVLGSALLIHRAGKGCQQLTCQDW